MLSFDGLLDSPLLFPAEQAQLVQALTDAETQMKVDKEREQDLRDQEDVDVNVDVGIAAGGGAGEVCVAAAALMTAAIYVLHTTLPLRQSAFFLSSLGVALSP